MLELQRDDSVLRFVSQPVAWMMRLTLIFLLFSTCMLANEGFADMSDKTRRR